MPSVPADTITKTLSSESGNSSGCTWEKAQVAGCSQIRDVRPHCHHCWD